MRPDFGIQQLNYKQVAYWTSAHKQPTVPALFCWHSINIRFCFPTIRTWLPGGLSINTPWQATWLLRPCVNSLGLLKVKASVFLQLWGMIYVQQPRRGSISLRGRLLYFIPSAALCVHEASPNRGGEGGEKHAETLLDANLQENNQDKPPGLCYLAIAKEKNIFKRKWS